VPFPVYLAGMKATAGLVTSGEIQSIVKTSDQSVTSSMVLVSDTQLQLPVAANASYIFGCYVDYEGGTLGSADLKHQWAQPAGAAIRFTQTYISTAGNLGGGVTQLGGDVLSAGTAGAGVLRALVMDGTIVTGATAGTMVLTWAQNTSSATPTIVHAQSYLWLLRTA